MRDYNKLENLSKALEWIDTREKDLVVLTVHIAKGPHAGYEDIREEHLFTSYEELLFTRVVALAEKVGKPVSLLLFRPRIFMKLPYAVRRNSIRPKSLPGVHP